MDINKVLAELDSLFSEHKVQEVEGFLTEHIQKAKDLQDVSSQVTLLNELIGFYRDTTDYEKSIQACQVVIQLLNDLELRGTVAYATTLQNVANALRAAGQLEASMTCYNQVFGIYENQLDASDMRYASLSNNMSLLYQEMGDFANACVCLEKALSIVTQHPQAIIEVATTHTNLAMSLMKLKRLKDAMGHIEQALDIFERYEEKDYHYSAALGAMAEAKYMVGQLEEAIYYYREAMNELECNVGKTENYYILEQNMDMVCKQLGYTPVEMKEYDKGMDMCQAFYEAYGAPMIKAQFPEYVTTIAVGLVGEGSDCFGFDDALSRDHDFGPGFCMWLTDAGYDEIGKELQEAYDALPTIYMGIRRKTTKQAGKRVGVFRISDFYKKLIGTKDVPETNQQWLFIEEYQLASATNGRVFRDDLGEFSRIRRGLKQYYPEDVYVKKIAREAALMAQTGQYNYSRMLRRNDRVTAHIAVIEFVKHTMGITYLLNRRYAPFYKWQFKGLEQLSILKEVSGLIYELQELPVGSIEIPVLIEEIANVILVRMKIVGLTKGDDLFLEGHVQNILMSIEQKADTHLEDKLVDEIVRMEWEAFDKVENQGGSRADCQDNWDTFSIMRKSQFLVWPEELLLSYQEDFLKANARGWNMVTEKYGRMMISTDPEAYKKMEIYFPRVSQEKLNIIEEIVKIQVDWMETFAMQYPKVTAGARSIRTKADSVFNTSYETYLRGELMTYSDRTVELYGRFVVELYKKDENLAKRIIGKTALLYGFNSIEDMENRL